MGDQVCHLTPDQLQGFRNCATNLGLAASSCEIVATSAAVKRMREFLDSKAQKLGMMSSDDLGQLVSFATQMLTSFSDEMEARQLMVMPLNQCRFYGEAPPFGEAVAEKFAREAGDIDEAAKCLAMGRNTACVFHLMRVMESAIQRLGKKLKVKADTKTANWHKIGQDVANAVNAMPGQTAREKAKKQKYGNASANLNSVRIAWRNDVMHPKATYTFAEAERIYSHVQGFIISLLPLV